MDSASPGSRYLRFLGMAVLVVAVSFAVGFFPTRRLAGSAAMLAMAVGCLVSLVGAAMAGWILVSFGAETPTAKMQRAGLAMSVRLVVAVALGLAAALSGELPRRPLLFWMAVTYMALLPLEVKLAVEQGPSSKAVKRD